jgi:hypothetical protein
MFMQTTIHQQNGHLVGAEATLALMQIFPAPHTWLHSQHI